MAPRYFGNALTPGVVYFQCERMRAALSVTSCAGMWRSENRDRDGSHEPCMRCQLGAEHAGELNASTSPLCGSMTCSRCHNSADRLIGGEVCVSCKNREYEFVKGVNAKGTPPVKLKCLSRRRLRYMAGCEMRVLSRQLTLDIDELVVSALRNSRDRVRIGFGAFLPPTILQARLF